jgi:hypothetical protein
MAKVARRGPLERLCWSRTGPIFDSRQQGRRLRWKSTLFETEGYLKVRLAAIDDADIGVVPDSALVFTLRHQRIISVINALVPTLMPPRSRVVCSPPGGSSVNSTFSSFTEIATVPPTKFQSFTWRDIVPDAASGRTRDSAAPPVGVYMLRGRVEE